LLQGQWFVDDVSNDLPLLQTTDSTSRSNVITYANGMRQETWVSQTNSVFALDDAHAKQIPSGARLILFHTGKFSATLRLSNTVPGGNPVTILTGTVVEFHWTGTQWVFSNSQPIPNAPTNFRLIGQ
jgi:hypothetical protein